MQLSKVDCVAYFCSFVSSESSLYTTGVDQLTIYKYDPNTQIKQVSLSIYQLGTMIVFRQIVHCIISSTVFTSRVISISSNINLQSSFIMNAITKSFQLYPLFLLLTLKVLYLQKPLLNIRYGSKPQLNPNEFSLVIQVKKGSSLQTAINQSQKIEQTRSNKLKGKPCMSMDSPCYCTVVSLKSSSAA